MENLQEKFTAAINEAKELPTHVNGQLQDHYKFFSSDKRFDKIMYRSLINPVSVFEALNQRQLGASRYYVKNIPAYDEKGNLMKKREWGKKLMHHKAWARKDVEVKEVTFDIIGIKRETSHLPAGVLIANVEFIK